MAERSERLHVTNLEKDWLDPSSDETLDVQLMTGEWLIGTVNVASEGCIEFTVNGEPAHVEFLYTHAIVRVRKHVNVPLEAR